MLPLRDVPDQVGKLESGADNHIFLYARTRSDRCDSYSSAAVRSNRTHGTTLDDSRVLLPFPLLLIAGG